MRTVKNRKRKFALGMKIAAMFSCIAIASVGFAAWIIVNNPADKNVTGNITASTVSTATLTLTANPTMDGNIHFGEPATMNASHPWLVAGTPTVYEAKKAKLQVSYEATEGAGLKYGSISVSLSALFGDDDQGLTDDQKEEYGLAKLKALLGTSAGTNYVDFTIRLLSGAEYASATELQKITYTFGSNESLEPLEYEVSNLDTARTGTWWIEVSFEWGDAFGGINPYNYYNDGAKNASTHGTEAETKLSAIYNAVHGIVDGKTGTLSYHVTISASASTTDPTPAP